jgi:hypothetical protein
VGSSSLLVVNAQILCTTTSTLGLVVTQARLHGFRVGRPACCDTYATHTSRTARKFTHATTWTLLIRPGQLRPEPQGNAPRSVVHVALKNPAF